MQKSAVIIFVVMLSIPVFLYWDVIETRKRGDQLQEIANAWEDAVKVAASTGRIALSQPVTKLQEIKREAEKIVTVQKDKECHDHLLKYMDFTIESFLMFMQDQESSTASIFSMADDEYLHWKICSSPASEAKQFKEQLIERVMEDNDKLARSNLRMLATALETYGLEHDGHYPDHLNDLVSGSNPYLKDALCETTRNGYAYQCELLNNMYTLVATPIEIGKTGKTTLTMTTGGVMNPQDGQEVLSDQSVEVSDQESKTAYEKLIGGKIKQRVALYLDHPDFEEGHIFLIFALNADGSLKNVKVDDERSKANKYLRSVGIRSVEESSPFPPFPKSMSQHAEFEFNLTIVFANK